MVLLQVVFYVLSPKTYTRHSFTSCPHEEVCMLFVAHRQRTTSSEGVYIAAAEKLFYFYSPGVAAEKLHFSYRQKFEGQ